MKITYDPAKRERTLKERGLDFEDAAKVFEGETLTIEDDRRNYGETRYQTYGRLGSRMVVFSWTPRAGSRRIISMRHCHGDETRKIKARMG